MSATRTKVGAYEVEQELGRGTFGVVYRARHPDDPETPVALKVVDTRGNLDHVMAEPALLAKIDHPCVIRVLDYFPLGADQLAIALEYVGGGDLKAELDEVERLPAIAVRELLVQIGGALAEAHKKGIVHRDLKPANILVDRSGSQRRYVLTDFGVGAAKAPGIRSEKQVAGTYLFMAPEQLRGRPGPQSDLWALGVVAYRMLTGQYPFPGPAIADLSRQIQTTTPIPPSAAIGERIDADLERTILRLLDRSETERIGSATELLKELGHQGDSRLVFGSKTTLKRSRVEGRQQTLDDRLTDGIRRNMIWTVFWAVSYLLIRGPLGGAMTLSGFVLFYVAHNRHAGWRKLALILTAIALVGSSWYVAQYTDSRLMQYLYTEIPAFFNRIDPTLGLFATVFWSIFFALVPLVFPVLSCGAYARATRFRREQVLLRAAAAGARSEDYLSILKRELSYRFEDVGFHLKYAEALAGRGDDRAAAIEARLLLVQDPYHFGGNLLLAQCTFRLGLYRDCANVCEEYLSVAGYCFEFQELLELARKAREAGT